MRRRSSNNAIARNVKDLGQRVGGLEEGMVFRGNKWRRLVVCPHMCILKDQEIMKIVWGRRGYSGAMGGKAKQGRWYVAEARFTETRMVRTEKRDAKHTCFNDFASKFQIKPGNDKGNVCKI